MPLGVSLDTYLTFKGEYDTIFLFCDYYLIMYSLDKRQLQET